MRESEIIMAALVNAPPHGDAGANHFPPKPKESNAACGAAIEK